MSRAPARLALALLAAFLVLAGSPGRSAQPAAAPVAPEFPYVNTLRTTGAEFSMPSGLAYDRAGTLYVADAALHAIFSVDKAGRARLFAGPASRRTSLVAGAFADGPARDARFDEPMGLAIAADGDLLVADANNHCLRRIHAGVVSTLAGHCTLQDSRDGPAAAAYFRRPLALALDPSNGDLYIADFDAGVRKLDAAGMVTTPFPDLPNKRITGIALAGDTLLVVDTEGCTVLHPHAGGSTRYLSGSGGNARDAGTSDESNLDGHAFAGFPYGGVALSPRDFVLGDVGMHDVRYLHDGFSRVIAGDHDVDALISGGGFADGRGDVARFNVPLAIAAAADGTLVVADAGNHVLRAVGPFDRGLEDASIGGTRTRALVRAPLKLTASAKRTPGPLDASKSRTASAAHKSRVTSVPSDDPPADPAVETIRLAGARLSMPSGLAYDSAGTLYVADAGLQTIFSVDQSGHARAFAGLAGPGARPTSGGYAGGTNAQGANAGGTNALGANAGGTNAQGANAGGTNALGAYADGPASSARFDAPMGLAVDAAGDLLVADANNHCLRLIHAGEVSTLAGRCTVAGNRDGPAASALFERPLALAVDRANGDVYIADDGGGVRKLSAAGIVTTPFTDQTDKRVTGVALADYNLLVVDASGLTLRDLPGGKPIRYLAGSPPNVFADGAFMSHEFGGFPYAAAALAPRQFVLTDARMHDVRLLNWLRSRVIAGSRDVDADRVGSGYVDGPGEDARFNAPLAIAVAPNGSLVVADARNHVLRRLGRFDRSWNEHSSPVPEEYHFRPDEYRVALVGNSAVWWSSDRPSSTQAAIERRLAADSALAAAGVHPRVVTFGLGSPKLDATVSAITEVIALEHFDTIVLELNTVQLPGNQLGLAQRDPASWKPELMVDLARLRTELAADGVTLLVAVAPIFGELVPWESYASYVDWGTGNAIRNDWAQAPAALANAVAVSGVPALDLTAPMLADEFEPQHRPLFMALDGHYSAYGRVFVGTAIGAELARRRSWLAMAGRVRRGRDPTR